MVCIIDDREDVWQGCGNLVQVKPYHFFRHTGDIHAPPGLEKRDEPDVPELAVQEDKKYLEVKSINEKENGTVDDENKEENVDKDNRRVDKNTEKKSAIDPQNSKTDGETKVDEKSTVQNSEGAKENSDKKRVETKDDAKKDKPTFHGKEDVSTNQEDHDDYLLYLEDILRRIHAEFYEHIDQQKGRKSLREIIPRVRACVLKGLHLTFSGLIPTHQKLHQSRAYKVAKAFGAEITQVRS